MVQKVRVEPPGALYDVTNRGKCFGLTRLSAVLGDETGYGDSIRNGRGATTVLL